MLLVDWIRRITIGENTAEDNTLRVSIDDTATVLTKARVDDERACNEREMICQLQKMNMYLSMITGTKL